MEGNVALSSILTIFLRCVNAHCSHWVSSLKDFSEERRSMTASLLAISCFFNGPGPPYYNLSRLGTQWERIKG